MALSEVANRIERENAHVAYGIVVFFVNVLKRTEVFQ